MLAAGGRILAARVLGPVSTHLRVGAGNARSMLTGGSEPIGAMDPRKAGPKGAGDKPYELKPPKQDGPPDGGYPPIQTEKREIKTPNVPAWAILLISGGVMTYGFWGVATGNRRRRALKEEKYQIRANLAPLLQSEEDVAYLERKAKKEANEAEIMKDVPGWVVGESVYHSKRWVKPTYSEFYVPGRWGKET